MSPAKADERNQVKYRVLLADCPWLFQDSLPGLGRGASKHYPCMPVEDICGFPLPPLHEDAILFLWRVASMQQEAFLVIKSWGFTIKSELVWLKRTAKGARWFGMGHYTRNEHEVCLIATRGRPEIRDHSIRSTFEAPVGKHSEKPENVHEIAERMNPGPFVEIFGRRKRAGWTVLGNQIES